jgi:hypothetical protein
MANGKAGASNPYDATSIGDVSERVADSGRKAIGGNAERPSGEDRKL